MFDSIYSFVRRIQMDIRDTEIGSTTFATGNVLLTLTHAVNANTQHPAPATHYSHVVDVQIEAMLLLLCNARQHFANLI